MWIAVLLFFLGLVLLIKGGDWFVDGATGIARRFKIPEIIVGATIVSIGTTLPEVMVSATSAVTGHGEIAYGNAVGSIICNVALIAAITIAVRPSPVDRKSFILPICFFFGAASIFVFSAYVLNSFPRWIGIILFSLFVAYMVVVLVQAKKEKQTQPEESVVQEGKQQPLWLEIVLLIVGAAMIAFGADLLVDNGTVIAQAMGVPEAVIALTFVALGTSLPELVTAITSLAKGHGALSLGNIIGANLFNLVLVTGLSSMIRPFVIPQTQTVFGIASSLVIDLPVMMFVMLMLAVPALVQKKLSRYQGIVLLAVYVGFISLQFIIK